MNRFTKYACLLTAAFGLVACSGGKVQGSYDIVPLPNEINEQGNAPFVLTSSTPITYAEGDTVLQRVANHLAGYIQEATGKLPKVKAGEGGIHLSVAQDIENPEGYRLTVTQEGLPRPALRRVAPLLPRGFREALHRHAGPAQHEHAALAPDRRPGLAHRNQEVSQADGNRLEAQGDRHRPQQRQV